MRIITSWHDYPAAILGRTERPLLNWFEKNVSEGETWLDIGAHYGYTAMALCRLVGVSGRVFAFEPMLKTAGCMAQSRALNGLPQLVVLPIALGATEGLEVKKLQAVRGMLDSTGGQRLHFRGREDIRECFLSFQFDWLWPKICGSKDRIDGVKIDVQGMELEVLQGMSKKLAECRPKLVVELHAGVDRNTFGDLLENLGYQQPGTSIESCEDQDQVSYEDDHSYAFMPILGGKTVAGTTSNP
jgi:FkbM family methyltransferase